MIATYYNIQRFCLKDGPGIRTTLFLKGCPLRCVWCHNPEGQSPSPELIFRGDRCVSCGACLGLCGARVAAGDGITVDREACISCGRCAEVCPADACEVCGKTEDVSRLFGVMSRDKKYYENSGGGVTVSGGEPLAQPEALLSLAHLFAAEGIHFAVETSGCGDAGALLELASLGTLFLYDIKGIDPVRHEANTGVSNGIILSNLEKLVSHGADIILRLPLIPGMNDSESDLEALCGFLAEQKDHIRRAEIMPYHRIGIGKAENVGRDASAIRAVPDGRSFADGWRRRLEASGAEIYVN